jgi:hypothetical protein
MFCEHEGFHDVRSAYDRQRGLLVFFYTCEGCGEQLREAHREEYQPSFDRHGNDAFLAVQA